MPFYLFAVTYSEFRTIAVTGSPADALFFPLLPKARPTPGLFLSTLILAFLTISLPPAPLARPQLSLSSSSSSPEHIVTAPLGSACARPRTPPQLQLPHGFPRPSRKSRADSQRSAPGLVKGDPRAHSLFRRRTSHGLRVRLTGRHDTDGKPRPPWRPPGFASSRSFSARLFSSVPPSRASRPPSSALCLRRQRPLHCARSLPRARRYTGSSSSIRSSVPPTFTITCPQQQAARRLRTLHLRMFWTSFYFSFFSYHLSRPRTVYFTSLCPASSLLTPRACSLILATRPSDQWRPSLPVRSLRRERRARTAAKDRPRSLFRGTHTHTNREQLGAISLSGRTSSGPAAPRGPPRSTHRPRLDESFRPHRFRSFGKATSSSQVRPRASDDASTHRRSHRAPHRLSPLLSGGRSERAPRASFAHS